VTRLAFAGTPEFSATILSSLLQSGANISLILTQPDRPSGRGMRVIASPVRQLAEASGIKTLQPASLKSPSSIAQIRDANVDALLVAAYGLILPAELIDMFPCINVHASLLPRWRGAAPIQRAILAGDTTTGVSIMHMDVGLDTGGVYATAELPIDPNDTGLTLGERLAELGACTLIASLPSILDGSLSAKPQSSVGASYALKIAKTEGILDWFGDAEELSRQVRAYSPVPVARVTFRGDFLRIWKARPEPTDRREPGEVITIDRAGVLIACGKNGLRLEEVQKPGGRRMSAQEFARGVDLRPGVYLASA
jgi:methionyl-tRNA formyltransferase